MSSSRGDEACRIFYSLANGTPTTGDRSKWPDVLAFKYPITDLHVLMQHIGIVDEDLRALITAASDNLRNPSDREVLRNLILQTLEAQRLRRAPTADDPAQPLQHR